MCHLCAINCFDTSSSYSFVRFSFSWNLGTSFINRRICPCLFFMYGEGWAESKRMGVGIVAASSAHCPAESLAAVVLNLYLAAACAP